MPLISLNQVPPAEVEALLDDAFGTDRHQRTAYLLRKGMPVVDHLSFGIVEDGQCIGSIQCWPIAANSTHILLVGPVAVAPAWQNRGLGHQLMNAMLAAILPDDPPMVMIGDPEYYGRFGFDAEGTSQWSLPGPWEPRRLLLRNPNHMALPVQATLGPRR
ncbi:GNAT family N-acetyltransferase [Sphingorhabdus contaminans]|uniref:N-acetyltransferase n=1 Tax=Sphingorhabdus contaminans TaxID=1343899 RepID=A0A553WIH6_9SPHN|nr:N-acetyltransferase [Sphingorhabdus contaminans]TSB04500.1 N-acetyltransferase [Sphingorhabdus contaminans]